MLSSTLSPETREFLLGHPIFNKKKQSSYKSVVSQLSPETKESLAELRDEEGAGPYWSHSAWYLLECPDGDYPTLHKYSTAESVARRIRKLEGEDVAVWVFHGRPAQITRKPHRYLVLPGETHALPVFDVSSLGIPPQYELQTTELEVQEDGFLGDPELTFAVPRGKYTSPPSRLPVTPDVPDDDQSESTEGDDGYDD